MKKSILSSLFVAISLSCFAQENEPTDTFKVLGQITVRSFEQFKSQADASVYISCIPSTQPIFTNKTSLVNGLNTVSGVRMEERSPGSYRINIRGSSLRSPFGVRNIKVYWNNLPVTDPGGNTYFNQFAWNNFSNIEIFKGPASSMYGAGSGGLILLESMQVWKPGASLEYVTGSYNLHNVFVSGRFGDNKRHKNEITYAHNQADGYRVQTKLRRDNFSWVSKVMHNKYEMTASVLFTDMYYQTPGALTLAEYNNDPKAARPAGGGFPSAVNAKAAIFQKNVMAGISNLFRIAQGFQNTTTLYGAFSQVKNSAIRNYERRNEPSFGGRTVFNFQHYTANKTNLQWVAGAEFQQGYFNTQVAKNKNGNPDTLQTNDDINNQAYSIFANGQLRTVNDWTFSAGASINKTKLEFRRLSSYPVSTQKRSYRNELAPRFAVKKYFKQASLYWLASVAKGFSPPTVAEVLPSTGVISTELEAEQGWNYETTVLSYLFNGSLHIGVTGFYFKLNNALVQRRDLSGADFFVNAGDVTQKGLELSASYSKTYNLFVRNFHIRSEVSLNHFHYGSFVKGTDDFSGKKVPSVPSATWVLLGDLQLINGIYLNANFYNASRIYLNDANTASVEAYQLLGCQLGWRTSRKFPINIFIGADNLLDEKYSLGNDINAAGNRFYNAAPRRNYYAGVSFQLVTKPTE